MEMEMGKGRGYFSMFASASPNHNIATLAVDTVGRRFYTLSFKDMLTGKMLADRIPGTTGNFEWANNNKTVFYSKQDPNTLRADKIYRHELGTETSKDVLVFLEKDQTLSSYIGKSRSKKFLIIQSVRTDASVVQFMEIDNNKSKLTVFEPLKENVQYSVDHLNGKFYIRTNADATNYRLASLDPTAQINFSKALNYSTTFWSFRKHLKA
jgi:oligopeptidase B